MNFQEIIAIVLVLVAAVYLARAYYRKGRAFSPRPGCGDDCGCSEGTNKSKIAA